MLDWRLGGKCTIITILVFMAGAMLLGQPPGAAFEGRWGLKFEPHENQMIWGKCDTDYHAVLDLSLAKDGEISGTADLCAWPGPAKVTNGSIRGDTARFRLVGEQRCTCGALDHPEFDVEARLDGETMHVTMVTWTATTVPLSGARLDE